MTRPHQSAGHARHEALLDLYVDGELSFADQPALFAHLADCAACRAQFNALMAFRVAARQEHLPVTPSMDAAFFARLDQAKRARPHPAATRAEDRQPFRGLERRVSVRTALVFSLVLFAVGLLFARPVDPEPAAVPVRVVETEDPAEALYVIYPGITIEDERNASRSERAVDTD
ncbi:MAG: zf-HC2 domain-containing protein [Bacteroidota bacterium]